LQPDLGGAVIILGMGVLGLLYLGLRFRYLLLLAGLSAGVFGLSFSFLFLPYQQERVLTFLNPSSDPLRSGYNVNQAQIAIGAGGLFGRGLGEGTQSQLRFLPESQTDFIFAVISEELGLFGVMLVFGAFLLLFWRLLRISRSVPDSFVAALAFFGFALFFVEFSLHVGASSSSRESTVETVTSSTVVRTAGTHVTRARGGTQSGIRTTPSTSRGTERRSWHAFAPRSRK
jgi:rod shape determining protein RodA